MKIKNIRIVSLSSGILGEDFVAWERKIGEERLRAFGVNFSYGAHALCGIKTLAAHPEYRAEDLLEALRDDTADMILCAIGGDDTFRLSPYLFGNGELEKAVKNAKKKIFLGFSDTTVNHLMFRKVGMPTFYGQAFLTELCEPAPEMLPYSRKYFAELLETGTIREITPSDVYYDERTDFTEKQAGTLRVSHPNDGWRLLRGNPVFRGEIVGGCLDTLYDLFDGERYAESPSVNEKYGLFPPREAFQGKILLLETSEEKMPPEKYEKGLLYLRDAGAFDGISGILVGKPQDGCYEKEYEEILQRVAPENVPILANLAIGHATPRMILPLGIPATVDATAQKITF